MQRTKNSARSRESLKIFETRKKTRQSLFKSNVISFKVEKKINHHISI